MSETTNYSNMSRAQEERMYERIARRIVALQKEDKERKESKQKLEENWEEGTDYLQCRACIRYSHNFDVPYHLQ